VELNVVGTIEVPTMDPSKESKMNTFIHKGVGIALLCVLVMLLSGTPAQAVSSEAIKCPPYEIVPLWGPYLTGVAETSITVNWKMEGSTHGRVEYATDEFYTQHHHYNRSAFDTWKELHHVELTGLSTDTTYHYRIKIGNKYTADHTFTTLGSESFTFIVYGDTREQAPFFTHLDRHKLVADRIAEEDVLFALHTGDLVCDPDDFDEWERFFEASRQMFDHIPVFPIPGNHESGSPNYHDTFGVPQWYSFECSNAHFTMLDSNQDMQTQADWMADDLNCDADWKFACLHHPPYSSSETHWGGWLDVRDCWEPVFIANGMNAAFSAHVHVYERYYENDIHYMVYGNGGAPCYLLAEEKIEGYRNSMVRTLGYGRVTVNGDEAYMDVIKVADISETSHDVIYVYPPNTVFERVDLRPETTSGGNASLSVTTTLVIPSVGISLDRDWIDYGNVGPDGSSVIETVGITNTGTHDVNVTLEIQGTDTTAQDFFEQSLNVNGSLYDIAAIIASILSGGSQPVDTQLQVPSSWNVPGMQEATYIFWAEAP
jgi:hypothetical protein